MGTTELTVLQKMKAIFFMFMLLSISLLIIYLSYVEEQSHDLSTKNVMNYIKSNFAMFTIKNDEDYHNEEFQSSYFDNDNEDAAIVLKELSTNPLRKYTVENFYIRSVDSTIEDIEIPLQDTNTGIIGSYRCEEIDNNSLYIQYKNPLNYEFISTQIPLTLTEGYITNLLSIKFENIKLSVEHITFYLQGDVRRVLEGNDKEYNDYYRIKIGEYNVGTSEHIQLSFDIFDALSQLEGKMNEGVSLVMLIDSDPSYTYHDQEGELIISDITPVRVEYANNTVRPWQTNGGYELIQNEKTTKVNYNGLENFESISTLIVNHQEICSVLNLEIKNIEYSVENITINVYGRNNEVVNIPIDLTKYSRDTLSLHYDLKEYNSKLGGVDKVELLIDSNPYKYQSNRKGSLEIISLYFTRF